MRFPFLRFLECPYCGSDFRVEVVIEKKEDELINGCVECECSEFPVLEGISILNEKSLNRQIIELIKERRVEEAVIRYLGCDSFELINSLERASLFPPPVPSKISRALGQILSRLAKSRAERKYGRLYKRYSDKNIAFYDLLGEGAFETYLKHRFSAESFWSLYPFLPLLKKRQGRLLDLNCGTGHTSFVISQSVRPQQLCCADLSFKHLYLARKYFAQNAEFVCLDANHPLPFKNGTFSSILMSDAVHYVHSHVSLAHEMERILSPDGLLLLLHVHNSLTNNRSAGYPLTPKAWANLFRAGKLEVKVLPERKVVENFLFHNKLDLLEKHTEATLNSSNAIILLATSDKSLLTTYDNVNRDFLNAKSNLIVNPIYEMTEKEDQVLLERPLHEYSLGDSYPTSEKYLPKKHKMRKESLSGRQIRISDLEQAEDLMRKFIIINVPEKYT
jgi:SAM-dependent methyltransferase